MSVSTMWTFRSRCNLANEIQIAKRVSAARATAKGVSADERLVV
jgi:hypothetical protein